MTQSDKFVEEARKFFGECVCHIAGGNGKYYCDLHKYQDKFALSLSKSFEEGRQVGLEEGAKVAESFKFGGDYKDCPAAWITACYDKFAKAIRERSKQTLKEST